MSDDLLKTEAGEALIDEAAAEQPSLEEQLAAANARADENYGKFLLAVADFDNFKKRMQRDLDSMVASRRRMLLERILPVLDNLERALESNAGGDSLRGGVEQTLRGFEAVLAGEGVKPLDVTGQPFDPRVAEAIGTADSDGVADDTVVGVAQKGYKLGDEVLRPAKVIVAKSPA
ncbi:MAG: nucleotide exchange factor GrpE [Candidatus Eremiobacteraeota bacterium]|nr:nucleotide exchange factor GrpE [Candidatus Eremiobacteraeota bacterium]MBV9264338.1 nucleotide exchange factor GrpE [Candidatus Eremiobacteraeota bacterium]